MPLSVGFFTYNPHGLNTDEFCWSIYTANSSRGFLQNGRIKAFMRLNVKKDSRFSTTLRKDRRVALYSSAFIFDRAFSYLIGSICIRLTYFSLKLQRKFLHKADGTIWPSVVSFDIDSIGHNPCSPEQGDGNFVPNPRVERIRFTWYN